MSKYTELKAKHQAEVNAFPFGFAFNDKQFAEMMAKWGLTPEDTDKLFDLGYGTYIRKTDADAYKTMMGRHRIEMKMVIKKNEDDFLFHMFNYELANHEYSYTYELDDTLDALGLTIEEINANPTMADALKRAIAAQEDM